MLGSLRAGGARNAHVLACTFRLLLPDEEWRHYTLAMQPQSATLYDVPVQ